MAEFVRHCSDLLFARPSFIEGVARILDFSGTLNEYNSCDTGEEADARAILSDWQAVGSDIEDASKKFDGRREAVAN